ncbi:hypothetical protein CVIC8964_0803 [Campylobacter vicugnae]|uniref:Uncharacterized protein n=1 Tax=Campylobacter vicugnae TaxID=1660076 RepID=A0A1X9T158_9BACT|nr:hypothetical protein [Campylobacter sp. RM8964]ARR02215.1 hypothetical protein CVIC8964_0803 [Campylobacter sp. RM8964]
MSSIVTNSNIDKLDELISYLDSALPNRLAELEAKIDAVTAFWKEANITGKEVQSQLINSLDPTPKKVVINGAQYDNFTALNERLEAKIQDVLSEIDSIKALIKSEIDSQIKYDKVEME